MRPARTALGAAVLAAGVLPIPAGTAAAQPSATTYHGAWSAVDDCGTVQPLAGNWVVVTRADGGAVVHLTTFFDRGVRDASWGGRSLGVRFTQQPPGGDVFRVTGGPFTFVLDQAGTLTSTIADYPCSGGPRTVTLWGQLTR